MFDALQDMQTFQHFIKEKQKIFLLVKTLQKILL